MTVRDDLDRQFDALCARYADLPPRAERSAREQVAARRLEHLMARLTAQLDARDVARDRQEGSAS